MCMLVAYVCIWDRKNVAKKCIKRRPAIQSGKHFIKSKLDLDFQFLFLYPLLYMSIPVRF